MDTVYSFNVGEMSKDDDGCAVMAVPPYDLQMSK